MLDASKKRFVVVVVGEEGEYVLYYMRVFDTQTRNIECRREQDNTAASDAFCRTQGDSFTTCHSFSSAGIYIYCSTEALFICAPVFRKVTGYIIIVGQKHSYCP